MGTITDKVRKVLWARSGNLCAMCKKPLILENVADGNPTVVGDECHIVSDAKDGPRYDAAFPAQEIDQVENLLLLCKVHHKLVDDNASTYTRALLMQLKDNHEKMVKERMSFSTVSANPRVVRSKEKVPSALLRISSGKELQAMLQGCMGSYQNWDENLSEAENEIVGGFLQNLQDYADLQPGMEPMDSVRASHSIQSLMDDLENSGFWVFAAREEQTLTGGIHPDSQWIVLHISILRKDNKSIVKLDDA